MKKIKKSHLNKKIDAYNFYLKNRDFYQP